MPRREDPADDYLVQQLKRWGVAVVNRYAGYYDGPSAGDSVLAKQTDLGLASKRKKDDERELVGRDGTARRRLMAAKACGEPESGQASGAKLQLAIVPMWAADPVPARNDADPPRSFAAARVDMGIPDDLRWVERAIASLGRRFPMREQILREEYTTSGSQRAKARRVAERYDGKLTLRQYRYELYKGLDWLRASEAA